MLKAGTAARRQSVRLTQRMDGEEVRADVEQFLHTLDARLQQQDATWVGHCKLLITSGDATAYASMTAADDTPRWAGAPVALESAEITLYVALYSWTDADVAAAVDGLLAATPILHEAVAHLS